MTSMNAHPIAQRTGLPKSTRLSHVFRFTNLFSIFVFASLGIGWSFRNEYWIRAESGLGYALGITGGVMMLMLLLYPLRKRFNRNPFFIFSTKNWFKLHMILGILGPLLILYHCNFKLGSTNSNIALLAMFLMVGSGLIGRYIYGKIHSSLFGKKLYLKDLLQQSEKIKKRLDQDAENDQQLFADLYQFGHKVATPKSIVRSLITILTFSVRSRYLSRKTLKNLHALCTSKDHLIGLNKAERKTFFKNSRVHIQQYVNNLRKIVNLGFYERLFSMWHMLHFPIFFMLIVTALIHVYAVHVY